MAPMAPMAPRTPAAANPPAAPAAPVAPGARVATATKLAPTATAPAPVKAGGEKVGAKHVQGGAKSAAQTKPTAQKNLGATAPNEEEDDIPSLHLLTLKEVFMYKIPPLQGSTGHRAADWNLESPAMTGQLRIVSKGDKVYVQLLQIPDNSALLPQLFASCPIKLSDDPTMPNSKLDFFVQGVTDSSRYFVLRVEDEASKRHAYLGIGFTERQSAFDMRATIEDELKRIQRGGEEETPVVRESKPAVDRSLKDGETIKVSINLGGKKKSKPLAGGDAAVGKLSLAASKISLAAPPVAGSKVSLSSPPTAASKAASTDLSTRASSPPLSQPQPTTQANDAKRSAEGGDDDDDDWGDFQG